MGTIGVHLICTLYPTPMTKIPRTFLLIAPALSGSTARPRAATLPINSCSQLCIWQSWRPLRSSADACGARAGGTGSAGCAGRRRIVAALGRGSLLWAPTKRGREHQSQTTCPNAAPVHRSHQAKLASADLSIDNLTCKTRILRRIIFEKKPPIEIALKHWVPSRYCHFDLPSE